MSLKSTSLTFIFSLTLAATILVYIFSSISFSDVMSSLGNVNRDGVAAFLVASFSTSFFRAWRYSILLASNGYCSPFPTLYLIVLVRNTFSDLLPARIGTLIYVFLVRTRLGVPIGVAGSSFALAFLFDMIAIIPLIIICLILAGGGHGFSVSGLAILSLLLFTISISLIYFLPKLLEILSIQVKKAKFIPSKISGPVDKLCREIGDGIVRTKKAGVYGRVFILSALIRLGKYVALYFFLYALLAPKGYSLDSLSFPLVFLGLCASELAASLPISGIAGIGAYQGAWIAAFTLLGFPLDLSKITSVAHHLFTQAYGYSLGFAAFVMLLLPLFKREIKEDKKVQIEISILRANTKFASQLILAVSVVYLSLIIIIQK